MVLPSGAIRLIKRIQHHHIRVPSTFVPLQLNTTFITNCRGLSKSPHLTEVQPEKPHLHHQGIHPSLDMQFLKINVYYQKNAMLPIHRAGSIVRIRPRPLCRSALFETALHSPNNIYRSCISVSTIYSDSTTEPRKGRDDAVMHSHSVTFLAVAPCRSALA